MDEKERVLIIGQLLPVIEYAVSSRNDRFELSTTSNSREALSLVDNFRPHLVIINLKNFASDGFKLCYQIKNNSRDKTVKVIMISEVVSEEHCLLGYKWGADDYITLPISESQLQAKVEVIIKLGQMQRELIYQNKLLKDRVDLRSGQLQRSERMANLGLRMAEVVHNLRNPLTIILGNLYRLKQRQLPQDQGGKEILSISKAVDKLNDIVSTILLVSREQVERQKQVLNFVDIIKRELEILETDKIFRYEVDVHLDLEEDLYLLGVSGHLAQLVGNLLINAVHSMINAPKRKLSVVAQNDTDSKRIILEISDTGHGISAENMNRVFDPFFTTKQHISSDENLPEGTGLGMPFVKSIVELYNGTIDLFSEEGVGTTVKVFLPTDGVFKKNVNAVA